MIREDNEIRIGNTVGDAFKVRGFQMRLLGPMNLIFERNPQAFTSGGWDHAEGKVFRLRAPVGGIRVHIPFDAASPAR